MSSITKSLVSGENIIFCTKKHLIIYLYPVVWTIFSFFAYSYMNSNPILEVISFLPWALAAFLWGYAWLEYYFSEFVVTNKRVIMREGFFFRHMAELQIKTVAQVSVDQSLLGQYLCYGGIRLNAFGAVDCFSYIDKPFEFKEALNRQLNL